MTLELSYVATRGVGSERRTARLLAVAERLAGESGDAGAMGRSGPSRTSPGVPAGRLEDAVTHLEEALTVSTTLFVRRGVRRLASTAQRFLNTSLLLPRTPATAGGTVPRLVAEADGEGNIYAGICFRTASRGPRGCRVAT